MEILNKQVLAFDIDGVIVNFFGPFLAHCNQVLGTNWQYEECTSHNLAEALRISEKKMHGILRAYELKTAEVDLPAIPGALESLRILSTRYEIAIITSRKPDHKVVTERWFARNFPNTYIAYAVGRNNPYAGGEGRFHKPQIAEHLGALCLVEDNEQEFLYWDSDTVEPICFAQPWNECLIQTHPQIRRLDWPGIVEWFMDSHP